MCDPVHTDIISDLPVLVELMQYPPELDNERGGKLADRLSEVASELHRHQGMGASGFLAMVEELACETVVAVARQLGSTDPADRRRLAGDARVYALGVAAAAVGLVLTIDAGTPAEEPAEATNG